MKKAHLCLQILRRLSFYWTVEFEVSLGEADRSNSKTKGIFKKSFCFKVTLCQTLVLYLNDSDLGNRNLVKMTENKENQSVWGPDPCIYNLDSLDMGTWNSDLDIIRHRQCLNRTQSGMELGNYEWLEEPSNEIVSPYFELHVGYALEESLECLILLTPPPNVGIDMKYF